MATIVLFPNMKSTRNVIGMMRATNRMLVDAGRFTHMVPAPKQRVEQQITEIINFINGPENTAC